MAERVELVADGGAGNGAGSGVGAEAQRRAAGLCVDCGERKPKRGKGRSGHPFVRCAACLQARASAGASARADRQRAAAWAAAHPMTLTVRSADGGSVVVGDVVAVAATPDGLRVTTPDGGTLTLPDIAAAELSMG